MTETTFPLPADVTDAERRAARDGIAAHATVTGEDEKGIRFEGEQVGQTGPVHRFQYVRLYRVTKGYLAVGHELRTGIVVHFAETAEELPGTFPEDTVREFVEDELRFRGVLAGESANA